MSEERHCQVCGCSAQRACPGGCAWVSEVDDVCTSCASVLPGQVVAELLARRDHFAAEALAGLVAGIGCAPATAARRAYDYADAMLVERAMRPLPAAAFPEAEPKEQPSGIVLS